jgi:subtilase family serine protease
MQTSSKVAALLIAASVLAACSGGGSVTPQTRSAASVSVSTAATSARFIGGNVAATNTGDFTYQANPPAKVYSSGVAVNAAFPFPPPSACESAGFACYTPSEIKTAYNYPSNYDGSGQTIVIIDAFGSPTIQQDLPYFDLFMGLPDTSLSVVYPNGQPAAFDGSAFRVGWAVETSLDVEWAHAMAPGAKIVLLVAPTNSGSDLGNAEAYAIQKYPGSIISMSYGAGEKKIPGGAANVHLQHDDKLFQQAQASHTTVVASAGDSGATNGGTALQASFPASDPSVLSVGGTTLIADDNGVYQSESVWNDTDPTQCPFGCPPPPGGATGGAPSVLFLAPAYQQMLVHPQSREVADVSYNAGTHTAVWVLESFDVPPGYVNLWLVGGTSAGAPQWAAIVALANQAAGHPLGFVNQTLYNIALSGPYSGAFHDITSGSNGFSGAIGEPAGPGYDMPTGLGTPNVSNLIPALLKGGQ